jgi:hypothetical protein
MCGAIIGQRFGGRHDKHSKHHKLSLMRRTMFYFYKKDMDQQPNRRFDH